MSKGSSRFKIPLILFSFAWFFWGYPARAENPGRFQYMGDGTLVINGESVTFRSGVSYQEGGLKRLHQIFGANWIDPWERLSLRFIEVMDYVQDQLNGKSYTLKSGYRSPTYNKSLRNRGKLAAQSSMHTEGAAADLFLVGVSSSEVFDYVKSLDCCGIGWYHSKHFHLDSGPSRYWDETSSKTEDKSPQQNEKIILQTDFDRYQPGETVELKFMRITEYPIGVPSQFELVPQNTDGKGPGTLPVIYLTSPKLEAACTILEDRSQARQLKITLPAKGLKPGRYAVKVKFCNRYDYAKMPEEILSRTFEVTQP